ncbi:hypothetical protein Y032_0079g1287 [Ancylostoma ceylanicum]|uniref:Uncharacterized protein n=1 Tax=Ancylostoma ceylanicum TaxID=53326 RepID=A0A016TTL4_9BILA|nr:hypothetical protein Y032_0079g1287 [Ancylostoma ceylanicum]
MPGGSIAYDCSGCPFNRHRSRLKDLETVSTEDVAGRWADLDELLAATLDVRLEVEVCEQHHVRDFHDETAPETFL